MLLYEISVTPSFFYFFIAGLKGQIDDLSCEFISHAIAFLVNIQEQVDELIDAQSLVEDD